jgi:hypothetical protein
MTRNGAKIDKEKTHIGKISAYLETSDFVKEQNCRDTKVLHSDNI